MLSEKSARIIEETLPAVGGAIGEITPLFYDKLFAAHPELLRNLFNRGNQANGSQRQALAGSIAAFASALIAKPDQRPDAMLERIANKHASLGVSPAQYEVVRTHLFAAFAEVLGEAVTPEVAAAWDEVYWLMANALIAIEQRLYAEAGVLYGATWRTYTVIGRVQETDDVVTFQVRPAGGPALPAAKPGQYVSVQVELPDGARQIRQYSLVSRGDHALAFAVKRVTDTPAGEVSNHLHDQIAIGAELLISAPFGDVTLDQGDSPVLLASAGIGCTPMIGMLKDLAATGSGRRIISVHGDRDQRSHAFRAELDQLTAKLPDAAAHVFYQQPEGDWPGDRTGLVALTDIEIPAGTIAYLCGPIPFLRSVRTQLLAAGVRPADIHYEVFGPDLWLGA